MIIIGFASRRRALCAVTAIVVVTATAGSPRATAAPDAPDDAAAVLSRAKAVLGFARAASSVIHYRAVAAVGQADQSDRSYPPFFSAMKVKEAWLYPGNGMERVSVRTTVPGSDSPPSVVVTDAKHGFADTKDGMQPLPLSAVQSRNLNAWAVVADWASGESVRTARREMYRDYMRVVLVRATPEGEQRLLVDPKTGFPVKLELVERHYLWGQRRIEYVYSNWTRAAGIMMAASSFRLADGEIEISQTVGEIELLAPSAVSTPSLPAQPERSVDELPKLPQSLDITTTAVGPDTYLLSNAGYNEAVTRIGDQVIIFDATQSEDRAKKDAEAIARLFPGNHRVTVVVTDLAWGHIAGVRWWVANGATIVTHGAARELLRTVIARRWTLAPDLLERRRRTVAIKLVGVDAPYKLAGGGVTLHPIDGIASEVAIMAFVAADRFLWASDYVQTVAKPTAYTSEVVAAALRDGLTPARLAAMHLRLTPWSQVEVLGHP
jgi:hypothetical protein